jgi:hypothetical protein
VGPAGGARADVVVGERDDLAFVAPLPARLAGVGEGEGVVG